MTTPMNAISNTIEVLLRTDAVKATKYLAPNHIVRATRKNYKHKGGPKDTTIEIILTIGRPNYAEREFVKVCKKAGEPFPVKKIQLRMPMKKKSGLKPRAKKTKHG